MKYYSEKLNKLFSTKKALEKAEASMEQGESSACECNCGSDCECNHETLCECNVADEKETKITTKKQLASDVEAAEIKLKEARADYDVATQKVEELSKKYLEDVNAILDPAKEAVKTAEKNRYEAIRKFNESYGAYQVTYTGDRAAREMLRAIDEMNAWQSKIFRNPFWF